MTTEPMERVGRVDRPALARSHTHPRPSSRKSYTSSGSSGSSGLGDGIGVPEGVPRGGGVGFTLPLPLPLPLPPTSPPLRGVTHTRRSGHVVGSIGGYTEDWGSVDTRCRAIAEDQVCKLLMDEPETAGVYVGSTLLTVRNHGKIKVFRGFERWVCTDEHEHKEGDRALRPRRWEGTRRYVYTAIVETHTM